MRRSSIHEREEVHYHLKYFSSILLVLLPVAVVWVFYHLGGCSAGGQSFCYPAEERGSICFC